MKNQDEIDLLRQTTAFRARLVQGLSAQCMSTTEFRHLLIPVTAMIRAMAGFPILGSDTDVSPSVWTQSDDLIQALLVVAQRVQGRTSGTGDPESDDRLHIPTGFAQQRVRLHSLRIPEVTEKTYSLTDSIAVELSARGSCSTAPLCLARVVPFIEILADSLAQTVIADAFTVKSVYKLGYVFGRVMLDLAQDGFCKPSEGSDTNKGGQDGDATEGTGMGTGTGDKNVSSEIEEEGQIEGLQGEQEEEAEGETGEKEDEDDAMSMDEDFEGAMGEGKEKDEQDGSKEGSEDDEHDEHVRDVDPLDPGAVDEKFWGKEEETEDDQNGDEDLANEKTKDSGGQTDLSAKEIEAGISSKQKENEADEAENPVQDTQHNISDNENHADEIEDLDNEGEDHPAGQDQSEVVIPEGDKLDLPEDIELEPDEHDEPAKDSDEDVRLSEGEDDERSDGSVGGNVDKASQDDGEAFEDAPEASGNTEEDSIQPEETANQNLDISVSNDAQAEDVRKFGKRFAGSRDQPDSTPQQREQDEGEKNAEDGNNGLPPPGEG